MSFTPFSALKTRVLTETLMTGNAGFAAEIPGFVALAEQRIYYGSGPPTPSDPVRVQAMETRATIAMTAGEGALPAGVLELRATYWPSSPASRPQYQPQDVFFAERGVATTGQAIAYTIERDKILLDPLLTGTLHVVFTAKLTALVADGDTNWLLANAPGVYFHAVLIEAYRYRRDKEKMAEAHANYVAAVRPLNLQTLKHRSSGGRLAPRIAV